MPKYRCHVNVQLAVELEAENEQAARETIDHVLNWPSAMTVPPAETHRPDGGDHVVLSRDGLSLRLDLPLADIHKYKDVTFKPLIEG